MTLYHLTTNPTNGFSWIELNYTYSYLPVITQMIPLFPYYPSCIYIYIIIINIDINCYNNHNLFIETNQIIIINNQYITRLSISDDKDMNNVSCTGQCDIIKNGMILTTDNNNPNEITIVDSLIDKRIYIYILLFN